MTKTWDKVVEVGHYPPSCVLYRRARVPFVGATAPSYALVGPPNLPRRAIFGTMAIVLICHFQ